MAEIVLKRGVSYYERKSSLDKQVVRVSCPLVPFKVEVNAKHAGEFADMLKAYFESHLTFESYQDPDVIKDTVKLAFIVEAEHKEKFLNVLGIICEMRGFRLEKHL